MRFVYFFEFFCVAGWLVGMVFAGEFFVAGVDCANVFFIVGKAECFSGEFSLFFNVILFSEFADELIEWFFIGKDEVYFTFNDVCDDKEVVGKFACCFVAKVQAVSVKVPFCGCGGSSEGRSFKFDFDLVFGNAEFAKGVDDCVFGLERAAAKGVFCGVQFEFVPFDFEKRHLIPLNRYNGWKVYKAMVSEYSGQAA